MNALRSALVALVFGLALQSNESQAVLILANGTDEIEWYVGQPAPSIDLGPPQFLVAACGAELGWVYANFPTIPTRTIASTAKAARRAAAVTPLESECVTWRGDSARFIADNLTVTTD